jgi:hypothetical protein
MDPDLERTEDIMQSVGSEAGDCAVFASNVAH